MAAYINQGLSEKVLVIKETCKMACKIQNLTLFYGFPWLQTRLCQPLFFSVVSVYYINVAHEFVLNV